MIYRVPKTIKQQASRYFSIGIWTFPLGYKLWLFDWFAIKDAKDYILNTEYDWDKYQGICGMTGKNDVRVLSINTTKMSKLEKSKTILEVLKLLDLPKSYQFVIKYKDSIAIVFRTEDTEQFKNIKKDSYGLLWDKGCFVLPSIGSKCYFTNLDLSVPGLYHLSKVTSRALEYTIEILDMLSKNGKFQVFFYIKEKFISMYGIHINWNSKKIIRKLIILLSVVAGIIVFYDTDTGLIATLILFIVFAATLLFYLYKH